MKQVSLGENGGPMKILSWVRVIYQNPVGLACGVLMAAITAVVFLQVVSRYVFSYPFDWPEELARYLFIWVALLGAALALKRGAHFSIDALVKRLPARWRLIVPLLIHTSLGIFTLVVSVKGFQLALRVREQLSPGMEVSMTYAYLSVPVSFAIMFKYVVSEVYSLFKK
ncbi:MAG TPA: TRAP transporter small permease [Thermodesulfobacteriota bacterium]|nr:TRAP transporter small permease [Thermodesulfobacteriota bacterium]